MKAPVKNFSVFTVNEKNNSQYSSKVHIVKDQQKFLCPADKEQKSTF